MILLLMAVSGGLGAATRFVVDGLLRGRFPHPVSVGTVVINVTGAMVLGLIAGLLRAHVVDARWLLVGGTGFLGGYTTFSTASFETVRLIQTGHVRTALAATLGQMTLALAGAAGGYALGTWL